MPRPTIPAKIRNDVLSEFNHRCAICGENKPQVHHIDRNHENNQTANLLPLCPNCHLTDQHNPTNPIEPEILALFRKHKDPLILSPQFQPLFRRTSVLRNVQRPTVGEFDLEFRDLLKFVKVLHMGEYYANRISQLVGEYPSTYHRGDAVGEKLSEIIVAEEQRFSPHRHRIRQLWPAIEELIVELLRFQTWPQPNKFKHRP